MPNKVHTVAAGDTFELISTQYFGEPSKSGKIRQANPGTSEILVPGTLMVIPADPGDPVGPGGSGLLFRVDGVEFSGITAFGLTSQIDAFDTVEITVPQALTEPFEELFTPLAYRRLEVFQGQEVMFTGTMVSCVPALTNEGSKAKIAGYSLPGVLNDCMAPASAYPVSFKNMGLVDIAKELVAPFSLEVVSEGDMGGAFRRVKLKRDDTILSFLAELAKQRQVLIRSNAKGELVFASPPEITSPVADLDQNLPPITDLQPQFAPQSYYSHLTGVRSTRRGNAGSVYTAVNPLAQKLGVFRPRTISIRDTAASELPKAVEAAMGRMLAGAVSYAMTVATWYDPVGARYTPGSTVQLTAPSVFIPGPYRFQIRSVKITSTVDEGETAAITLMLPGAFGGTPPERLPWPT